MNKQRISALYHLSAQTEALQTQLAGLQTAFGALQTELDTVCTAEQRAYDNMPEGLQYSDRGQRADAALDHMDDAKRTFRSMHDSMAALHAAFDTLIEQIEKAASV